MFAPPARSPSRIAKSSKKRSFFLPRVGTACFGNDITTLLFIDHMARALIMTEVGSLPAPGVIQTRQERLPLVKWSIPGIFWTSRGGPPERGPAWSDEHP